MYYITGTLTKMDCKLISEMNLVKKFHDLLVEFRDFPWPQSFSMTVQAWKIPFLNSITFQDVWEPRFSH